MPIMVHLNHPDKDIDVYEVPEGEYEQAYRGQGYVSLYELRELQRQRDELKAACEAFLEAEKPMKEARAIIAAVLRELDIPF